MAVNPHHHHHRHHRHHRHHHHHHHGHPYRPDQGKRWRGVQGITNLSASAAYDASHREYAWTVYQVNREVVVVMLESFIFWVYRYRRSWWHWVTILSITTTRLCYNASHREYAWTGFQVNRDVITMLLKTFVDGWLFFQEYWDSTILFICHSAPDLYWKSWQLAL